MLNKVEAYTVDLIYRLNGSCDDIMAVIDNDIEDGDITREEFHDNEMAILEQVDNAIFNCARCGWWFELCELEDSEEGDLVCSSCNEE